MLLQVNILSMFSCKKIQALDDFFVELKNRREKGVYFYRINGYSENIRDFAERYYEAARLSGVVIEGRIPKEFILLWRDHGYGFSDGPEFYHGQPEEMAPADGCLPDGSGDGCHV